MLHLLSAIGVMVTAVTGTADSAELRREALMTALRGGGYSIVLRHAATDRTYQEDRDRVPVERDKQRNLSAEGVRQARLMGEVFTRFGIPIGEIISSPMFRTMETAEMAAGKPTAVTMALRVFPPTPEQAALVTAPPPPGTNRLLVTHHFVIETHVPGIRPGDIGEGEAVVVRPDGKGAVVLVGRITIGDWNALAPPAFATTAAASASTERAATGAAAGGGPELPDTPVGRLAAKYLQAYNSGNTDWMRLFLDNVLVPDPERPVEDRLATWRRLYDGSGPLTLVSVDRADDASIEFSVDSKMGPVTLVVRRAAALPDRVESVTIRLRGGHP